MSIKKTKFPLTIGENKIRNIEDLREHFDIIQVYDHYINNSKLKRWLDVWGFKSELEALEAINHDSDKLTKMKCLCEIFKIEKKVDDSVVGEFYFYKYNKIKDDPDEEIRSKAKEFLEKAAKFGHKEAKKESEKNTPEYNFKEYQRLEGSSDENEKRQAIEFLEKADQLGHSEAKKELEEINNAKYLQQKAEKGDAEAQYHLALLYLDGTYKVPNNYPSASYWLYRAAEKGHEKAQYHLGKLYLEDKDFIKARKLLGKSFESEYSKMINKDTEKIYNTDINKTLFLKDIQQKAEKGDAGAQYQLALIYLEGSHNIQKNYRAAFYWFHKAAEQEHKLAQYNLGKLYLEGKGTEINLLQAKKLLKKATDAGIYKAWQTLKEIS